MAACQKCAKKLTADETGISLRLLGRDGRRLLCRECLASELRVEPQLIDRKIQQFRDQGCPLFPD